MQTRVAFLRGVMKFREIGYSVAQAQKLIQGD